MVAIDSQETFLKNQQIVVRIKPVETLGFAGDLIETYVVKISFDKIWNSDDNGKNKTLFERTVCDKGYSAFAPTLSDAIALVRRFIERFELEFERMTT